jgi:hypothetical protein
MHYIEKIIEPKSLLLSWQAPESIDPDRRRKIVGILKKKEDNNISFQYLMGEDLLEANNLGFDGYGNYNDFKKIYEENVLEEFARRLPQKKRRDYNNYLKSLRIYPESNISDFALLGYSGALLPSDSFSLVHTFEGVEGNCQLLQEVAGFRFYMNTESGNIFMDIALSDPVNLEPDPSNEQDRNAVKIVFNGKKIGYINKVLAPTINRWLVSRDVKAHIEKVAGTIQRPRVFIFISVS